MAEISLLQAIRNAIEAERAAERFYRGMIEHGGDAETHSFIERVAAQERGHAEQIEAFVHRIDRGELPEFADGPVDVVESDTDWARVDELDLKAAVGLAIELEDKAKQYYEALAGTSSGELYAFFTTLVRVEEEHRRGFQKLLEIL